MSPYYTFVTLFFLCFILCIDAKVCVNVYGRGGCWFFEMAKKLGDALKSNSAFQVNIQEFNYETWPKESQKLRETIPGGAGHRTSPFVYLGCDPSDTAFIGGYTEMAAYNFNALAEPRSDL